MTFIRARVALSLPKANPQIEDNAAFAIHVGHARTLLIGSEEAQKRQIPFHIRLDNNRHAFRQDTSPFVLDIVECVNFLSIKYDRIYWRVQDRNATRYIEAVCPDRKEVLACLHPSTICPILDDVEHYPSLIVRGMEFVEPETYLANGGLAVGSEDYCALERKLIATRGVVPDVYQVPLITMGGLKMSKTEGRSIHWACLRALGASLARNFLMATAVHPSAPCSVLHPFQHNISTDSFEWSWDVFKEAINVTHWE